MSLPAVSGKVRKTGLIVVILAATALVVALNGSTRDSAQQSKKLLRRNEAEEIVDTFQVDEDMFEKVEEDDAHIGVIGIKKDIPASFMLVLKFCKHDGPKFRGRPLCRLLWYPTRTCWDANEILAMVVRRKGHVFMKRIQLKLSKARLKRTTIMVGELPTGEEFWFTVVNRGCPSSMAAPSRSPVVVRSRTTKKPSVLMTTTNPSVVPTSNPSKNPSKSPSRFPTKLSTGSPTRFPSQHPIGAGAHILDATAANGQRFLQLNFMQRQSKQAVLNVYVRGTCWYPEYVVRHRTITLAPNPPLIMSVKFSSQFSNTSCTMTSGCHWNLVECPKHGYMTSQIRNQHVTVVARMGYVGGFFCLCGCHHDFYYQVTFTCAPPNLGPPLSNSWTLGGGAEKSKARSWSYNYSASTPCRHPRLSIDLWELGAVDVPTVFSIGSKTVATCRPKMCAHASRRCVTYLDMEQYIGKAVFDPNDPSLIVQATTSVDAASMCVQNINNKVYNAYAKLTMTCFGT